MSRLRGSPSTCSSPRDAYVPHTLLSRKAVRDKRLRRRTPVRFKHVRDDLGELLRSVGLDLDLSESFLERAHFEGRDLILVDRVPLGVQVETGDGSSWFPTLRGIVAWKPERCWAAVDHGAIPFLMNGADCMGAGIHMADPALEEGDLVWIRDQEHGKPLALGLALVSGDEMVEMTSGKAIQTLHWIGDDLWELDA